MTKTIQTILVTGASSGFGRDTAETLAAAGHNVFAGVRDIADRNRVVADALRAKGAVPIEIDVTSDASVNTAIATLLVKSGGKLDAVINNAGVAAAGVSESFTPGQLREIFEVNLFGVHRVTRAILPTLRAQGDGLIVNVGSIVGRITFPFFGLYGASKHAIEALTDSYRYELSQLGVDVVLIQPSAYPTNIYATMKQSEDGRRAAEYGELGAIPVAMFENFKKMFASANAPNPYDVAEAVAKLIVTPKGQRPARVVVGQPFGADAINDAVAPIQRQVVDGMGLGALAALKV